MILDLVALGLVSLAAVVGGLTGARAQAIHLVGLGGGWAAGRFVGLRFGPLAAAKVHLPPVVGVALLAMLLGFGIFVVVHLVGKAMHRRVRKGKRPGAADRALGVLLGAAKSALAVWLLVSVIVIFEAPVAGLGWKMDTRRSEVAALARRYNLLAYAGVPLKKLKASLSRRDLAADPRMRRMAKDAALHRALDEGDYVSVLRSADVLNAWADPDLRARILGTAPSAAKRPASANAKDAKGH